MPPEAEILSKAYDFQQREQRRQREEMIREPVDVAIEVL